MIFKRFFCFLVLFFVLSFVVTVKLPSKKLTIETAIEQGIPLLGMTSHDLVKALGEPDNVSRRADGMYGLYYKEMNTPLWDEPLKDIHFVFKRGHLAVILKGEPLSE